MSSPLTAREIDINGVVQGVGFRPFLFVLAKKFNLSGQVSNTDSGVCLIVEGQDEKIEKFLTALKREKPNLAIIINMSVRECRPKTAGPSKSLKAPVQKNGSP